MNQTKIGRKTWKRRFGEAYKLRWKVLHKSQGDFANKMNEIKREKYGVEATITDKYVSKWLNGSVPNDENIEVICEILDLPLDYFEPTDRDQYLDSSKYITELGQRHVEFAEEIGLDLNMVKALHSLIDCDSLFPQYSPIIEYKGDLLPEYKRQSDFAESAPIDPSLDFLQIQRDGRTLTLHQCDLAYLKEVQDQVVEFVEYLFYKRHGEMEKEVEEVNRRTHLKTTDGGEAFRPLNQDEMFEIDRFAKYAYKEVPKEGGQDNGEH